MEGSSEPPPNAYLQDQISPGPSTRTGHNAAQAAAATRGAAAGGSDSGEFCSYMEDCTTGSPLRKVVSHIFGRNKLCTRQIPSGVWVHYCRKHYQRSRYRNPNGFALLQCDLVRKQIDRLQVWGGVSDWIVKIRKREEVRLSRENAELGTAGAVQGEAAVDDEDDEDDEEPQPYRTERQNRRPSTPGARASAWLRQSLGEGKSTAEVLEILGRIEHEIRATGSNSFPDVEILPNVITTPAPRRNTRATPLSSPAVAARTPTPRGRNSGQSAVASPSHDSASRRRLSGPAAAHSRSRSDSTARARAGMRSNTNMAVGSSLSSSTTTGRLRAVSDAPPRKRKGSPPPRSSRVQIRTPAPRSELDDDRRDDLPSAGRGQAVRFPALVEGASNATSETAKRARRRHGPGSTPLPTTYAHGSLEEEDEDYQDEDMEEQTAMSPPSRQGRSSSVRGSQSNSLHQERMRRTSFMERMRAPRRPSPRAPTPAPDAMDLDVAYATTSPATERIPPLPQPLPPTARLGQSSMAGEPHPESFAPASNHGDYHFYRHGSDAQEEATVGHYPSDANTSQQVPPRSYSGERYAPFRERRGY